MDSQTADPGIPCGRAVALGRLGFAVKFVFTFVLVGAAEQLGNASFVGSDVF